MSKDFFDELDEQYDGQKSGKIAPPTDAIALTDGEHTVVISSVKWKEDDVDGRMITINYTDRATGGYARDTMYLDSTTAGWKIPVFAAQLLACGIDKADLKTKAGREKIASMGINCKINVVRKPNKDATKKPYVNVKFLEFLGCGKAVVEDTSDDLETFNGVPPVGNDPFRVPDKWDSMSRNELIKSILNDAGCKAALQPKKSWTDENLRDGLRKYFPQPEEEVIDITDEIDLDLE